MIWAAANERNPNMSQLFYYLVFSAIQTTAFFAMLFDIWYALC